MAQSIALGNSVIHQIDGFYSLKDLHIASGSAEKHKPSNFMRLEQTQALIHELAKGSDMSLFVKVIKGCKGGTYACRELVIAYAAWISAAFHLKVIRVFLQTNTAPMQPSSEASIQDVVRLLTEQVAKPNSYPLSVFEPLVYAVNKRKQESRISVNAQRLQEILVDLKKIQNKVDGLVLIDSDLAPEWWQQRQIGGAA